MIDPCNMARKSQILLGKTILNTKAFFHKTLHKFKSFIFGGYRKLPAVFIRSQILSCSNGSKKNEDAGNFWQNTLDEVMENAIMLQKEQDRGCSESITSMQISAKNTPKEREQEDQSRAVKCQDSRRGELPSQSLEQKLKQLEMMEASDVDHVLDIEEVLHYYSRLTSPVYLDIVDKFFMDMYSEYSLPQPSLSADNSMRRNSSLRRLGPVKL